MYRMIHSRVYKPTVWPVASCSLFLGVQEVTLLLGEYSLFAHAKFLLPHYKATLIFFNNTSICSILMCVYTYDGM